MRWSTGSEDNNKSAILHLLYLQVHCIQVRVRTHVGWETVLVAKNCLFWYCLHVSTILPVAIKKVSEMLVSCSSAAQVHFIRF